jgi:hypothetical protein
LQGVGQQVGGIILGAEFVSREQNSCQLSKNSCFHVCVHESDVAKADVAKADVAKADVAES